MQVEHHEMLKNSTKNETFSDIVFYCQKHEKFNSVDLGLFLKDA